MKVQIVIAKKKYIIDFSNKVLLDLNNIKVKGASGLLRIYFEQEKIPEPKNTNNHTYIGIIKKYLNSNNNLISEIVPHKNITKINQQKIVDFPEFKKINNQQYLLNCSGKKINTEDLTDLPFNLENLAFNYLIGEERKELLDIIQQKNIELYSSDNKKKIENNLNFSRTEKAYLIYSKGKVFNAANSRNWSENETNKVYILSALFGIIKATDFIPIYDLALDYKLNNEPYFFKKYWKKNGKIDMIINQLNNENVTLINLMSNNYNSIFNLNHINLVNPGIIWKGRGDNQGKWLKNQFEK